VRKPHRHLRRLDRIFEDSPIFFVTTCTFRRRPILATPQAAAILTEELRGARERHGWNIARYVVMPDHVHFFCAPRRDARELESFMGMWKQWTAKRMIRELGFARPVWQLEFHEHLMRSEESCVEKWEYVWLNPVRAGLVERAEDWPFSGEIFEERGLWGN
jgi:putative transposase